MRISKFFIAWVAAVSQQIDNEITAIPFLIKLLDISGSIIAIDAMGTQTKIASQIITEGGDYVLALNENQPRLFENTKLYLDDLVSNRAVGRR